MNLTKSFISLARVLAVLLILGFLFASCSTRRPTTLHGPNRSRIEIKNEQGRERPTRPQREPNNRNQTVSLSGQQYIERYKDIAISEMNQYGIPASIKLAQALLESGNGNSFLAKEANNHFGIKQGSGWNGLVINKADDRRDDLFRVYSNPEGSFKDHSQFLLRKRYESLFKLEMTDYKGWARGLKAAGYATNPRYPDLLIDLIERYGLSRFDRSEPIPQQKRREEKIEAIIKEKTAEILEQIPEKKEETQPAKAPVAMVIHEVKPSDTLYSIAQKYGISMDELKEINAMDSDNIYVGQLLVVAK